MTDERPLTESDAVTPTKTALVLDLADGRTVELTAHIRTHRDSGLRALEERDPENEDGPDSQRAFDAASTTLILRDVDAEDDDPIGLLPTYDLDLDVDVPDDWERLDEEAVAGRIGDPYYHNPVFQHDSFEAWAVVTRRYVDGYPGFYIYLEAGDPESGLHEIEKCRFQGNFPQQAEDVVQQMLDEYDHGGDGGSE